MRPTTPPSPLRAFAEHLLRRFELYLAVAATLLVTAGAVLVVREAPSWATAGVAFGGLFALQIAIQWADRERQRRLRAKAIHDIREMLKDRVLNQLATLKVWASMTSDSAQLAHLVADVDASIDEVADMVTGLSEEQLNTWQLRYAQSDAHRFSAPLLRDIGEV